MKNIYFENEQLYEQQLAMIEVNNGSIVWTFIIYANTGDLWYINDLVKVYE